MNKRSFAYRRNCNSYYSISINVSSICLRGFQRQVLSLSFPFLELNASPVGNCGLVPGHHFLIQSHCHEHCFVCIKGRSVAFALYGQNWKCVSQSASKTATPQVFFPPIHFAVWWNPTHHLLMIRVRGFELL